MGITVESPSYVVTDRYSAYTPVLSLSHASTQVTGECNSVIFMYNLL